MSRVLDVINEYNNEVRGDSLYNFQCTVMNIIKEISANDALISERQARNDELRKKLKELDWQEPEKFVI